MTSGVNRGSDAQSVRKRRYCCGDMRFEVPPGTSVTGPPGVVLTLVTWQIAQLMATRGKPTVTFDRPTGISRPGDDCTPSDAHPPGSGRYSGKIRGSTSQIQ